jgi:hypothetical protein
MPLFWIPLVLAIVFLVVYWFSKMRTGWGILGVIIALVAIPIIIFIDEPAKERRNAIPPSTCITCKIELHGTLYAIGCDGHEYRPNVSAWALLNVSECK